MMWAYFRLLKEAIVGTINAPTFAPPLPTGTIQLNTTPPMADQKDLDAHCTTMDKESFRLSLGEKGGYSGARFDGDFSLTMEQAQEKKHKFIMDHCNIKPGDKVLDIGCGWGAFIDYLDKQGVKT